MKDISPFTIETTIITATGRVTIPRRGKITVKPVINPTDEKKSGRGKTRSSYSSILILTNLRGLGANEDVP
jgi:hypothetical protein